MKVIAFTALYLFTQLAFSSECTSVFYDNSAIRIYERTESVLNSVLENGNSIDEALQENVLEQLRVNQLETCRRSAIKLIREALKTGQRFDVYLTDLAFFEPSERMNTVSVETATTKEVLLHHFPEVSRDVLTAHRTAQLSEEGRSFGDRVGLFLSRSLNARSIVPRDGDDPDAILSRVEALLNNNNLQRALREVAQLEAFEFERPVSFLNWLDSLYAHVEVLNELDSIEQSLDSL
jgi:hypothetical protein